MTMMSFAEEYAGSGISRFHMPGHKGAALHGLERYDLTEIKGADHLFESEGIIAEGERLTALAYGSAATFWSAEGSSLSIKSAMCILHRYLGRTPRVAAARNCHRAFIDVCALLGIDPVWLYPEKPRTMLCECRVTADEVRRCLSGGGIDAVYITSPDYLGGMADIEGIAAACHEYGAFLAVDNAHGAYLRFVGDMHPLTLGADIVCDSAHKTLPVYTGGGYLHISENAPGEFVRLAKDAMALFGSTSPSYLIMQSLDLCAGELHGELPGRLRRCCERTAKIKSLMRSVGMEDISEEPMKITIAAERFGYDGSELAELMRKAKMECEYSDHGAVVLMLSPYNSEEDLLRLEDFIRSLPKRPDISCEEDAELFSVRPERVMSIRDAMLSACTTVSADEAEGRICARTTMNCQPSVAAVMAGEKITADIIKIFKKYSIFQADVL